ncbi:MAG: Rieske (2Fe-2S) protein [Gemmataceae bacterium]|nr:Rieske (2Fe-2S) protein [Gemmataceae bacterium]
MAFVTVAQLSLLLPGKGTCVEANGKKLALFLANGKAYAIDEECPHRQAPLHEGECVGLEVVCPWHASFFSLETGDHRNPPATTGVRAYRTRIVGEEVQVEV